MSRRLLLVCISIAVSVACGCNTCAVAGPDRPEAPQPVLSLAGQSYAFRAEDWSSLPPGPGAEARPGDFVLHNGLARFVVAADDHRCLARIAGNVIDAALQGGEDRMRLLAPLIGDASDRQPVCDAVRIAQPGGVGTAAVVVAEYNLPDRPRVRVATEYALEPDSRTLKIATTIANDAGEMLSRLSVGDALYHGRTLRFTPDAGLMPTGQTSSSNWLAFFVDDLCWGVLPGAPGVIEAKHDVGRSALRYAWLDVAAGESRVYERRLIAGVGGPECIWNAAYPVLEETRSRLVVSVKDRETGRPVPGSQVMLAPCEGSSAVMVIADCRGEAALDLAAGQYSIMVWKPGRPAEGPLTLGCVAGCVQVQPITLAPPVRAIVKTRMRTDGFVVPASVRVAGYPAARPDAPFPPLTPFPLEGWSGAAFAEAAGVADLLLTPAAATALGSSLIVASRGPLFRCDAEQVGPACGQEASVSLTVERVVDPGSYVSVDCRQEGMTAPECLVEPTERVAANTCEGLTAAVLSGPAWQPVLPGLQAESRAKLIPGLRVPIEGIGSFSAYPLNPAAGLDLARLARSADAWECVELIREALPDAVIQVDDPLNERTGHFALSRFDPLKQLDVPPEVNIPFDAVELVSDGGLPGIERTLAYWFALLNAGRRVALTGSSGACDLGGASRGAMRTFLHCPSRDAVPSEAEISNALRALRSAPNAVVSNGPFVEATMNGQPIGSVVKAAGHTVRLEFRVSAPAWVDIGAVAVYRNGEVVQTIPLEQSSTALRTERQIELEAPTDCWFAVCVSGPSPLPPLYCMRPDGPPAFAVTNPFWVDADGDGEVRIRRR